MPESTEPTGSEEGGAANEVKEKFREALERKRAHTKSREKHQDAGSKVNNAHGPVGGKREFRRKSG